MTPQHLDLGTHRLAFVDEGSGPAVLLLHSLAGSLRMWDALSAALARDHRVLRFDARGHGATRPAGEADAPFTIESYAADALALLDARGVARCVAVGISMGGSAAMQLALAVPERIRALVVANSSAGGGGAAAAERLAQTRQRIGSVGFDSFAAEYVASRMAHGANGPGYAAYLRDTLATGPARFLQALGSILAQDLAPRLPALGTSALLIGGDKDVSTTPERMRALAGLLPDARYTELHDAGHFSAVDQPGAFNAATRTFIGSLPPEGR